MSHNEGVPRPLPLVDHQFTRATFAVFTDALSRQFRVLNWKRNRRQFWICHGGHVNDRIAAEAYVEFFQWAGVPVRVMEFGEAGNRPQLRDCLGDDTLAVIGYNSQLDHSWLDDENFVTAAQKRNIPVIQSILDHPSVRWPEFTNSPESPNARYLFLSPSCEQYFRRYALPSARTGVLSIPTNRRSRVERISRDSFLARDIRCIIPLNLRRVGGTAEELEARIGRLQPDVAEAVREAIELARTDLENALVVHLEAALERRRLQLAGALMHACTAIVHDMTQIWRRRRIFQVAARFPVLIQTDLPPPELAAKSLAAFRSTPEWTDLKSTLSRYQSCQAVVSVSFANDALHDRTANALNAGCVAIAEDNVIHRRLFESGHNALFFRYDDDSLAESLQFVCDRPAQAYPIARAGMKLRDKPKIRYFGWQNALDLACSESTPRSANPATGDSSSQQHDPAERGRSGDVTPFVSQETGQRSAGRVEGRDQPMIAFRADADKPADPLAEWRAALANQEYERAYAMISDALARDPLHVWPSIVREHSAVFAQMAYRLQRRVEMANLLARLYQHEPDMICIPPNNARLLDQKLKRADNIEKGIPSFLLVAQAKSASTSAGNIVPQGFALTCITYSMVELNVVPAWARDFANGGAAYITHLSPTVANFCALAGAGLTKIIVHTRDPRQLFLSLLHHHERYRDDVLPAHSDYYKVALRERANSMLDAYEERLEWLNGWINAGGFGLEVLFTTFEEFVTDRNALMEKMLDFYGGPMRFFNREEAMRTHDHVDYHFRAGEVAEWKQFFDAAMIQQLNDRIPGTWFAKFGWNP